MIKRLYVLALVALLSVSCGGGSVQAPEQVTGGQGGGTVTASGAVPGEQPVASSQVIFNPGPEVVVVQTGSAPRLDFKVCTYQLIEPFPGRQILVDESPRLYSEVGSPGDYRPRADSACALQIDVIDWRICPREGAPPTFGGGLIQGYLTGGPVCQPRCDEPGCGPPPQPSPSPTPTPTPTPSPTPSPSPSPTPAPVGTCHVSNKGNPDDNNNLQVSWKLHGEGHEKHICPEFNPPDFRSTEADCILANVRFCTES